MATTGAEIAKAYVAITVKAPGIQKDIAKELGAIDGAASGKQIGAKFSDGMKKTLAVTGAGIAAVLGTALVKGFGRLKAIETAQAKMRGLGHDSDTVAKAMDNALASVKGTAFGLGDAATAAGQLMAANIKPGKQLEGVLKTVANNAAAAGTGFDEMGSIFAKAATQANGVQNDIISQLADKGIPIYQALAEQMGVTAGEVFKMASEGKISFEVFEKAASAAAGTVADEMGNTTTGAFDNMMAALGRLGAKMLEDVFPLIGPMFKDVTAWLDEATMHVEPLVTAFGSWLKDALGGIKTAWQWLKDNSDWLGPLAVGITAGAIALKGYLFWNNVLIPGMKAAKVAALAFNAALKANPAGIIITAITALVAGLVWFFTQTETGKKIWGEFTRFLGEAWANVSSFFVTVYEDYLKPVFDGIATVATWVFENILQPLFLGAQIYFSILGGIFMGVWEYVLRPIFEALGAIFGWIYNTIIVPIIDGIVLYVKVWAAIFTWLWRNVLSPIFGFIGAIFKWIYETIIIPIINGIKVYIEVWAAIFTWLWQNAIKPAIDGIAWVFKWLWENVIKPVWDGIQKTISDVWNNKIKPIIDTLSRVIQNDPKKAFEAARDAIGTAWAGIQDLAKKPVRFVVETVINGLIDTINKIPGVNLAKVPLPPGFSAGGYTGALPTSAVAGVVHGDEHVIRATSRRAIEASHPGLLDHMNQYGKIPGYAKGGLVHPMPGAVVTEEYGGYPGHRGIDLAKPMGTPIRAAASGAVDFSGWYGGGGWMAGLNHGGGLGTRYKHMMSPPIVGVGQMVKQKQIIGYEGSTGDSTGPHLHYEVLVNGNRVNPRPYLDGVGDAGILDLFGGLKDLLRGQFTKAFPGSDMWIDAAWGVAGSGIDAAINWGKSMLPWGGGDPLLYDNGGWLNPGTHLVENRSGRPEPILTASQWDQLLESRSGRGPVEIKLITEVARDMDTTIFSRKSGRVIVDELEKAGIL